MQLVCNWNTAQVRVPLVTRKSPVFMLRMIREHVDFEIHFGFPAVRTLGESLRGDIGLCRKGWVCHIQAMIGMAPMGPVPK